MTEFDARWEGLIERLVERGFTLDEIVAEFDVAEAAHPLRRFTRSGERLAWGSLHDRRRVIALLSTITGVHPEAQQPPSGHEWQALVVCHRKTNLARPKLDDVAEKMGWNSEQPLRDLIHRLGFKRWHDVHAAVAAAPE